MSLVLPRSRATFMPGWVRNDLWRRARAVPSLDLRFAENKSLVDAISGQNLVTFTRASSGTYVDSAGVLRTAANDEPRFDHNPTTGESLGLLVEEQRTNSLANNTMVGAAAGAPGTPPTGWTVTADANGISREIVGIGIEDGITYIDIKYSGTTTTSGQLSILPSTVTAITAASGQIWTASAYAKLQAGSLSGLTNTLLSVNGRSSVGGGLESVNTTFIPSSSALRFQRQVASITLANASTARVSTTAFAANYASGVTIDVTLRIGLPQLEQGALATSVIPTTTSAATRNADVASITGSNFSRWYRQGEGTVMSMFDSSRPADSQNAFAWALEQESNSYLAVRTAAGYAPDRIFPACLVSGSSQYTGESTATTGYLQMPLSSAKSCLAFRENDFAHSWNGLNPYVDNTGLIPTPTALVFGDNVSANVSLNGRIRRFAYWPSRLPNSTLQSLTQ